MPDMPPDRLLPVVAAAALSCLMLVQTGARAQETNMKRAHDAAQSAMAFKRQGDLDNAEKLFRMARDNAPQSSSIHREAEDELVYFIPLMRVQRLLWEGEAEAAEEALLQLQLEVDDQPGRRQEVNRILQALRTSSAPSAVEETQVDEHLVARRLKQVLNGYYAENQRYPTSRAQLSELLDFSRPPLAAFDIERYASDGYGYLLILQSKHDANQTLTLHNTGLMQ